MTRQELQNSVARVLERERRVICQWATGVGKSQVALNFLRNNPGTTCLILVPEQNNIANWITEFDKFDVSPYGVEIACYASFKKYENTRGVFWCLMRHRMWIQTYAEKSAVPYPENMSWHSALSLLTRKRNSGKCLRPFSEIYNYT